MILMKILNYMVATPSDVVVHSGLLRARGGALLSCVGTVVGAQNLII